MKPSLAFPYHDPDGTLLPHLYAILPGLKTHFVRAYVCPPVDSVVVEQFTSDDFFKVIPTDRPLKIGERFAHLYLSAARLAEPDEILHLAYVDRLAFALETSHREQFLADVDSLTLDDLPLIFHRSASAWATHPQNYARLEAFVTRIGETLFGKTLDYAWCHLVVRAGELREIMPKVTHPDLSMVAEMILNLQHHVHTREVDWLAWEDPFLTGCDAAELKAERESSPQEYEKRLSYCLPMVDALTRFYADAGEKLP
jgi:hypothetical protein